MTLISGANPALVILQQTNAISTATEQKSISDRVIDLANGQTAKMGVDTQPTPTQAKILESLFSVTKVSVVEAKLDLIERTGEALGVKQADYDTAKDFVKAMQKAVREIRAQPGGEMQIARIEYELGLNKLDLSIDDVIDSAKDPDRNDKVTAALEKQFGKLQDEESEATAQNSLLVTPDEIGLYRISIVP